MLQFAVPFIPEPRSRTNEGRACTGSSGGVGLFTSEESLQRNRNGQMKLPFRKGWRSWRSTPRRARELSLTALTTRLMGRLRSGRPWRPLRQPGDNAEAPALDTAAANSANPTKCIPAWMIGCRMPKSSVMRVFIGNASFIGASCARIAGPTRAAEFAPIL